MKVSPEKIEKRKKTVAELKKKKTSKVWEDIRAHRRRQRENKQS